MTFHPKRSTPLISSLILACGTFCALPSSALEPVVIPTIPAKLPLPYIGLEAENATGGLVSNFSTTYLTKAAEASGRRYVSLTGTTSDVTWTVPQAANSVVVRFSIPDSADGLGQNADLTLLVNGEYRATLKLTSKYAWVYGAYFAGDGTNRWPNNPSVGSPHAFWDEAHALIGTLNEGDQLTLQKPQAVAFPIDIDFIDLEQVGPELTPPVGSKSVIAFGAKADGVTDDAPAFRAAIAAAAKGGTVWIPRGTYFIGASIPTGQTATGIVIPANVRIQGAGMWYSKLVGAHARLRMNGSNIALADFAIFGETTGRNDTSEAENAITGNPGANSSITRLWIEHKKCGFWAQSWSATSVAPSKLTITQSRIRNVMADGINIYKGLHSSVVDNNQVRNTGDDALASWSPASGPSPNHHNHFTNNTVALPWMASGIAIYGGDHHVVMNNDIYDGGVVSGSGIYITNNFNAHPLRDTILVAGNKVYRSGSQTSDPGGPAGALRVLAWDKPIELVNILFQDNLVVDSIVSGISIQGDKKNNGVAHPQNGITFRNNTLQGGAIGIDIRPQATGSATFENITVTGAGQAYRYAPSVPTQFNSLFGAGNQGF